MNRVAVFVDAGYVFAQGSVLLAGRKLARGEIILDNEKFLSAISKFAQDISGLPLLRVYWYDGTSTGPTSQHIALAYLAGLKLRLGFVNSVGEQKGVDSLIVTDMIALARNRAMCEAVLLSGDEDLRVGVQQAQEFGVRVHLLGIKPSRGSQSLFLLQESDVTYEWGEPEVSSFMACRPKILGVPPTVLQDVPAQGVDAAARLRNVAHQLAGEIVETELEALVVSLRTSGQVPKELDGKLLGRGRAMLKQDLDPHQKKSVRKEFTAECELRLRSLAQNDGPATRREV
jgi:hypothetical protein